MGFPPAELPTIAPAELTAVPRSLPPAQPSQPFLDDDQDIILTDPSSLHYDSLVLLATSDQQC